jgi:glycosyltransferase involved in cell wall biosynthesis
MPLSICHITSMHDWHDDRIFQRTCKGLVREGVNVTCITTYPEDKTVEGVPVLGLKERSGIKRRIFSSWEAYQRALKLKCDIYHFHDPDLLPFMILLKWRGRKVIYDIHENYVVRMKGRGFPNWIEKLLMRLWSGWENFAIRQFDGIVPVTESMGNLFTKSSRNTLVISNMIDIELLKDVQIPDPTQKEKILYCSGHNTPKRNCIQMIEAMPAILKEVPEARMLMGGQYTSGFKEVLQQKAIELGVQDKVTLEGSLPWRDNFNRTVNAYIGCVFWEKDENYSITIPARVFEYMFCGLPILADNTVELKKVIDAGNCGILINSDYPDQIAKAAIQLLKNPEDAIQKGRNGRKAMLEKFNFNMQLKELIAFYHKIAAK